MKDDGIVEILNARENRRKAWFEYVIAPFDGIRKVDGTHARLPGDAVQFLQGEFGFADRQLDPDDKTVGLFLVHLNTGVIDDLRQMRALLR